MLHSNPIVDLALRAIEELHQGCSEEQLEMWLDSEIERLISIGLTWEMIHRGFKLFLEANPDYSVAHSEVLVKVALRFAPYHGSVDEGIGGLLVVVAAGLVEGRTTARLKQSIKLSGFARTLLQPGGIDYSTALLVEALARGNLAPTQGVSKA